jgi:succinoglycan biosynthesis protein ExoA
MTSVSVVIVTYGRTALLEKAFNSLLSAAGETDLKVDVHLLINGFDPESLAWVQKRQEDLGRLQTKIKSFSTRMSPAAARNALLDGISSSWIFFMDDDVQLPSSFFNNFKRVSGQHPQINVWGGPNLTPKTLSHSDISFCAGWYIENPLITGPVSKRYRISSHKIVQGNQFNLMLCNLFVKAECLKSRGFLSLFRTAEENELFYYFSSCGWQMAASADLYVWHERRAEPKTFLKQIFYYGFGRGQVLAHAPVWRQIYFILPLLFIFCLGALVVLMPGAGMSLLILWLMLIKFQFLIHFKRRSILPLVLPPLIWLLYSAGILKGLKQSL